MSQYASFFLTLILLGFVYGAVVIATTPEFVCDGYGLCDWE